MSGSKFTCPSCATVLTIAKPLPPGSLVKCPKCGTTLRLPGAPQPVAVKPPPPAPSPAPAPPRQAAPRPGPAPTRPQPASTRQAVTRPRPAPPPPAEDEPLRPAAIARPLRRRNRLPLVFALVGVIFLLCGGGVVVALWAAGSLGRNAVVAQATSPRSDTRPAPRPQATGPADTQPSTAPAGTAPAAPQPGTEQEKQLLARRAEEQGTLNDLRKTDLTADALGIELLTLRSHGGAVRTVALSPDGKLLASAG